jgi:hypothetical protein
MGGKGRKKRGERKEEKEKRSERRKILIPGFHPPNSRKYRL